MRPCLMMMMMVRTMLIMSMMVRMNVCVFICNYDFFFTVCVADDLGGGCLNEIRYMSPNGGSYLPDVRYPRFRLALKKGNLCKRFGVHALIYLCS